MFVWDWTTKSVVEIDSPEWIKAEPPLPADNYFLELWADDYESRSDFWRL